MSVTCKRRAATEGREMTFGSSYQEVRKMRVREIWIPVYVMSTVLLND